MRSSRTAHAPPQLGCVGAGLSWGQQQWERQREAVAWIYHSISQKCRGKSSWGHFYRPQIGENSPLSFMLSSTSSPHPFSFPTPYLAHSPLPLSQATLVVGEAPKPLLLGLARDGSSNGWVCSPSLIPWAFPASLGTYMRKGKLPTSATGPAVWLSLPTCAVQLQ